MAGRRRGAGGAARRVPPLADRPGRGLAGLRTGGRECPDARAFEYSVIRVAPCVEREEFVNAGVILFCKLRRFLGARIELDEARLLALQPCADVAEIRQQLDLIPAIAAGGADAGEFASLGQAERFRWLASPRNTVVQPSPVHPGLCDDPQAALDEIFARLVLPRSC